MTDKKGTPLQVNIDLTRHGEEIAAFLHSHGLSTKPTELHGTVTGSSLTPLYCKAKNRASAGVLYQQNIKSPLLKAVEEAVDERKVRRGPMSVARYTALLLTKVERLLNSCRHACREPAPAAYSRYGSDMFWIRFHVQTDMDSLWCACYTLHEATFLIRYIGRVESVR